MKKNIARQPMGIAAVAQDTNDCKSIILLVPIPVKLMSYSADEWSFAQRKKELIKNLVETALESTATQIFV